VADSIVGLFGNNSWGTFDIYSIGDGLYMSRVMNGVAMLSNSGDLLKLGAIGMMLGLIFFGVKAVASGMQKFEMGWLFVSLLMFMTMFGAKSTVYIHDMGGAPGVVPGGTFPVGNVPFGVAAAGALISNLGMGLTQTMETSFGIPNGISTGGFGESLRWVNAVRNWDLPEIDDPSKMVGQFKWNLSQYLGNCYMYEVDKGNRDATAMFSAQDPFSMGTTTSGGIGVTNQFVTTPFKAGGPPVDMPCDQAYQRISSTAHDSSGNLMAALANAIQNRGGLKTIVSTSAPAQLNDSFNAINVVSSDAQMYTYAMGLSAAWADMVRHNGANSSLDTLSDIMVSTAAQQRATQWAASEQMFRRVALPMTAFFESMIYACAPFMALVLGFGAWGFQMVMRYLILTIWVTLWFPVLSIINLYQVTMAQHAVSAMAATGPQFPMTSMAGAADLSSQIVDWLSTGALLASSTPAITLMLIFGGAVSAGAIAQRMMGAEHINTKMATPDPIAMAPAVQHSAMNAWDQGHGSRMSGTDGQQPSIQIAHAASVQTSSMDRERAIAAQGHNATYGEQVASQWAAAHSGGVSANHGVSFGTSANEARVGNILKDMGVNVRSGTEAAWTAVAATAASLGVDAGVKMADKLGLTGGLKSTDQAQMSESAKKAFGEMVDNKTSNAHSLQVATAQAQQDLASQTAAATGSKNDSVTGSTGYAKSISDVNAKESAYQTAATTASSVSSSQSIGIRDMASQIAQNPALKEQVAQMAAQYGGGQAQSDNRNAIMNSKAAWSQADKETQKVMGDLITLDGQKAGGTAPLAGYEGERAQAMMHVAQAAGFIGASSDGQSVAQSNAHRNEGVGGEAHSGDATNVVNGQAVGADRSAGSIKSEAKALESGSPAATSAAMNSVVDTAGAGGVRGVNHDVLDNPSTSGKAAVEGHVESGNEGLRQEATDNRHTSAEQARKSGAGENARGLGGIVSMVMSGHLEPGVMRMSEAVHAGSSSDAQQKLQSNMGTEAYQRDNAANEATYAKHAANPGVLIGSTNVSSEPVARALAAVQTFKETGRMSPAVAQAYNKAWSEMTPDQRGGIVDFSNHDDRSEWATYTVTALSGGPVAGVKGAKP